MKALTAQPSFDLPPGDKTFGIGPYIRLYTIEEGDNTEEGEDAEILIIHDKSLASTKQNLVKRKLPYIDMFNNQGHAVLCAMRNITSGVFEHL